MPTNFEWQTEDETSWEEAATLEPQRPLPPRRPRLLATIGLLLLITIALVAYRQVDNRVTAVTTTIESDIRAGFALHKQAIQDNDLELYNSILSGSDLSWTRGQQVLLESDLLIAPWTMGLTADAPPEIIDIAISPDLLTAEVITIESHRPLSWANTTITNDELIQLKRTYIYRQGSMRWLHSPPRADFWGEWQLDRTTYLTLHFPERDAVLAKRLLTDLDPAVAHACSTLPDLNCPEGLHFSVYLDSDPNSLVETADPQIMLQPPGQFGLRLPTPSLIGEPQNDTAYQALLRGYVAQVVSAAIIDSIGYECCEQGLIFQALLDKQLAQLGIRPWPLEDNQYQALFDSPVSTPISIRRLWRETAVTRPDTHQARLAYSLVDYVTNAAPDDPVADMQRRLPYNGRYWRWMNRYADAASPADDILQRGWLNFMQERLALTPQPIPLPDQDIVMLCNTDNSRETSLMLYDTATATWTTPLTGRPFLFMNPLPNDSGVLLQERLSKKDRTQVLLWQKGVETAVSKHSRSTALFRTSTHKQEETIMYLYDLSAREIDYQLLPLASCATGTCQPQSVSAPPIWSPNGHYTIVTTPHNELWLGDKQGQRQDYIATGTAPFWLDNNTLGFVLANESDISQQQIVLTSRENIQPQPLLSFTELTPHLPDNRTASELIVRAIHRNPQDENHLFIAASLPGEDDWHDDGAFLFGYDQLSSNITMLLQLPFELPPFNPFNFSSNGKWLTIKSIAQTNATSRLDILNLEDETTKSYLSAYPYSLPGYDWSADERWLLRVEDGFIHLIAPEYNSQHLLVHNQPRCNFAAWVNKT